MLLVLGFMKYFAKFQKLGLKSSNLPAIFFGGQCVPLQRIPVKLSMLGTPCILRNLSDFYVFHNSSASRAGFLKSVQIVHYHLKNTLH